MRCNPHAQSLWAPQREAFSRNGFRRASIQVMRTGSNLTAISICFSAILMTVRDSVTWMAAAGILLVCRMLEVAVLRKEGREDVMQFRKVSLLGLGALMLIAGMA